jgi:ribose/xylose/arabinose/galactoside ABC-type transport system permease subunit
MKTWIIIGVIKTWTSLPLVAITLATLLIFIAMALEVENKQGIVLVDFWFSQGVVILRNLSLTYLAIGINDLFLPIGIASIIVLLVIMLIKRRPHFHEVTNTYLVPAPFY